MKYLAVDTANTGLTVIIKNGEQTFFKRDDGCGTQHSVKLMPIIEELLIKSGLNLSDLDFLVAVTGAGSFTGIRIGVSTISALSLSLNKPILAVTSFDTMAYTEKGGSVLALIDAKHGSFYACGYKDNKVVIRPSYISLEQVKELETDYTFLSIENTEGVNSKKVDAVLGLINAIEFKKQEITYDLSAISPVYVRKSQAEEGR